MPASQTDVMLKVIDALEYLEHWAIELAVGDLLERGSQNPEAN